MWPMAPPPSSRFQDRHASSVDMRSPNCPASADSTGLSTPPPKCLPRTPALEGLPRPEDRTRLTGGDSGPPVEKREERAGPRPRRDAQAQACEAQDHHLHPEESAGSARWARRWFRGAPLCPACVQRGSPQRGQGGGADLKPGCRPLREVQARTSERVFGSGLVVSGIKPPGHHFSPMSEKFLQEVRECHCETVCELNILKLVRCFQ